MVLLVTKLPNVLLLELLFLCAGHMVTGYPWADLVFGVLQC
jgi:hypothetical protein